MQHHQHVSRSAVGTASPANAAAGAFAGFAVGIAWYDRRLRRTRRPAESGPPARAVRRDWPDDGHDFAAFGLSGDAIQRWTLRDAAYWQYRPVQPSYSFVSISAEDFYRHRRSQRCTFAGCPQPTQLAAAAGEAVR